jgi:hypothetical protein
VLPVEIALLGLSNPAADIESPLHREA